MTRSAVEYRHLISNIQEVQNIAVYGDKMLGKMELFRGIVVFLLWIHSGLRKL